MTLTFIDLFGGIGGFRIGMESAGFRCVGYYDIDRYACAVYNHRFGEEHEPTDIRTVDIKDIPDHDIICAGFPCQDFSIAGKRKGIKGLRGTLFYEIIRVARGKGTPYLFLENVKGLLSSSRGWDFTRILCTLDECGYDVQWEVFNSKDWGVPQNRERIFIIASLRDRGFPQVFPIRTGDKEDNGEFREGSGIISVGNYEPSGYREGGLVVSSEGNSPTVRGTRVNNVPQIAHCLDANYQKGSNNPHKRTRSLVAVNPCNFRGKSHTLGNKTIGLNQPSGNNQTMILTDNTGGNIKERTRDCENNPAWCLGGSETKIINDYNSRIREDDNTCAVTSNVGPPTPRNAQKVLTRHRSNRDWDEEDIAPTLRGSDKDDVRILHSAYSGCDDGKVRISDKCSPTISTPSGDDRLPMVYHENKSQNITGHNESCALRGGASHNYFTTIQDCRIRRLTPVECEKLQGFLDNWTQYGSFPDGVTREISDTQRYKMCGNAVTTNVIRAIARELRAKIC